MDQRGDRFFDYTLSPDAQSVIVGRIFADGDPVVWITGEVEETEEESSGETEEREEQGESCDSKEVENASEHGHLGFLGHLWNR